MNNISTVLDYIYENETTTQRKIAKDTNLALGNINSILQLCIKKGLVKIEKINRTNIKYILTPEGMLEKTKYAYNYLQASIRRVLTIKSNLESILSDESLKFSQIVFYGQNDDTKTMLQQIVAEKKLQNILWINEFDELKSLKEILIIVWQPDSLKQCWESDIKFINILSC